MVKPYHADKGRNDLGLVGNQREEWLEQKAFVQDERVWRAESWLERPRKKALTNSKPKLFNVVRHLPSANDGSYALAESLSVQF